MELIKIEKDFEKAKCLHKLALLRYNKIDNFNIETESSLVIEAYYEICKELMTAILFCEGYKTLSHKDLLKYFENSLSKNEFELVDDLRKRRNKIVYYGIFQPSFYIKKNKDSFEEIINKLQEILNKKLEK